jgi:hypothetical protein
MFDSDNNGVSGGWNILKNFLVGVTKGGDLLFLKYLTGKEIIKLDFHHVCSAGRCGLQKDAVTGSGCLLNGVLNVDIALTEGMVHAKKGRNEAEREVLWYRSSHLSEYT